MITLSFHGAAGTVTGSKYLLEVNGDRLLIDAGMFQGPAHLRQLNWDPPPFDPESIAAVVLTHAHIDHIGFLPKLVKLGFAGPVYCSMPTSDLVGISLLDSAHIQEEDAEFRNRKRLTHHEVALPLYTVDDAEYAIQRLQSVSFGVWTRVSDAIRFRLHIVGHILGAASVEVAVQDGDRQMTLLFSGDIGRYGNPLTVNPGQPPACDYLVCESTYGARMHEPSDPRAVFIELINRAHRQRSLLLIPAFAVGRTQQITYLVNELVRHKMVPPTQIHIDSPMAISATEIYCKYHAYHGVDLKALGGAECVLEGKMVSLHRKRASSKQLNKIKGPAIIMSASGMLTAGRILHHLLNRLDDPSTILVLVGYMAEGTLGRRLAEGDREVRIHKQPVRVRAEVFHLHGLSGHADFQEILHWLEPVKQQPKQVFVTHGEPPQALAMAGHLQQERGWHCHIPVLNETVEL